MSAVTQRGQDGLPIDSIPSHSHRPPELGALRPRSSCDWRLGRSSRTTVRRTPMMMYGSGATPCFISVGIVRHPRWHDARARSRHGTHEVRSQRPPTSLSHAPRQHRAARRLPALRVERGPPTPALSLRDDAGHEGPLVQPPGRGPPADRVAPRLRSELPDVRARIPAPRGRHDRAGLRLRPSGDRPALPAHRRGPEPARREPRAASCVGRSSGPAAGTAALPTSRAARPTSR